MHESSVDSPQGSPAESGAETHERTSLGGLHGASPAMNRLYRQIEKVAATDAAVLIVGESGTGKELVAHTVHDLSARREQAFIPVNCGAIVPTLVEAELFGHEKGSFTGALERRAGYFEQADGGTLFLDEISEMAPATQVKLLHVLERGTFFRVGGTDEIRVNVRVIAATNRDLWQAAEEGHFRQDLLYRLAVFPLHVPPLRERRDDIERLARHFVDQLNEREETRKLLSRRAIEVLRSHPWPGNVRELRNVVQRAFILADRQIDIPASSLAPRTEAPHVSGGCLKFGVGTPLAAAQRELIYATLAHFGGDKRRTARALGISLKTLYNRLEAYGDSVHVRRHHRPAA